MISPPLRACAAAAPSQAGMIAVASIVPPPRLAASPRHAGKKKARFRSGSGPVSTWLLALSHHLSPWPGQVRFQRPTTTTPSSTDLADRFGAAGAAVLVGIDTVSQIAPYRRGGPPVNAIWHRRAGSGRGAFP